MSPSNEKYVAPSTILIVGSGVFGLSTAWALSRRAAFANTKITILDRSVQDGEILSPDAASMDSSRIVRSDYADPAYTTLGAEAHREWRKTLPHELGGSGRYNESGLILVANSGGQSERATGDRTGMDYVRASYQNVLEMDQKDNGGRPSTAISELSSPAAVKEAVGCSDGNPGDWGYVNKLSGWADASASMKWLLDQVISSGRVEFKRGTASSLLHSDGKIEGVNLQDGTTLTADLTILATGAWTSKLIDLTGICVATGHSLGYIDITDEEQRQLENMSVVLNLTTGLFVIPPRNNVLKLARHAYGYLNPSTIPAPLTTSSSKSATAITSVPRTSYDNPSSFSVPAEEQATLRQLLTDVIPLPSLRDRPFSSTRLCWYSDTKDGNFLVDYHPDWRGLFVCTGDSGHAFKFLPVLGEKVVDCVSGTLWEELRQRWAWRSLDLEGSDAPSLDIVTRDGSRGGRPGLILDEELRKGMS